MKSLCILLLFAGTSLGADWLTEVAVSSAGTGAVGLYRKQQTLRVGGQYVLGNGSQALLGGFAGEFVRVNEKTALVGTFGLGAAFRRGDADPAASLGAYLTRKLSERYSVLGGISWGSWTGGEFRLGLAYRFTR
mgnify:CR=1 FL=1